MTLETSVERLELPLAETFRISRSSTDVAETVVVRIEDSEQTGIGAAAPSTYYGETVATVEAVLPELLRVVEAVGDPFAHQRIEHELDSTVGENPAAKSAVTTALADLAGKRLGVPLYRQWGLDPAAAPLTSYSMGVAEPETMVERARERVEAGFGVLKLKIGTDPATDRDRVAAVRDAVPDATIRVDANGGYDPQTAVAATQWLADLDVEFVEQPVPGDDLAGLQYVHEHGDLPVAADESCVTAADVPAVADRCDIVVGKLAKCGSPWALRRQLEAARVHGLETMVGCMVESNASLAPATHLSPLADYADLDGSLLLDDDPFAGVPLVDGRPDLASLDRPGTGVRES
jgi:L-alanine-DL-glutamate epimerase-like enolase superfamily enzyme